MVRTVLTWDARNHLAMIDQGGQTTSYTYDPFGRRVNSHTASTTTTYLHQFDTPVIASDGSSTINFTLGATTDSFITRSTSTATAHYLRDGLGNVVALTDSSGAVSATYAYEPFGLPSASGTTDGNSINSYQTYSLSLCLLCAPKDYSPTLHRFVSEDPIDGSIEEGNLYAYVGNSPPNFVIRSGLTRLPDMDWPDFDLPDFDFPSGWEILQGVGDCASGYSSLQTFFLTDDIQKSMGTYDVVNRKGRAYKACNLWVESDVSDFVHGPDYSTDDPGVFIGVKG